jgi:hypothetical protein
MPALLVHLTLAKDTAERGRAVPELGAAALAEPASLLLGSILPDLPYHARFGGQLVRHLLGRAYRPSKWGDIFHHRGTGQLALALVAHLRRAHLPSGERTQVLALLAGYLSHLAVDTLLHPLIDQMVTRLLRPGEPPDVVHTRIERHQSLLFHRDRLGVDLAGSSHPLRLVSEVVGVRLIRPDLPEPLWAALRAACLETHGRAPLRPQVRDWLWGIAAYGRLMSSPAGRRERLRGDLDALRAELYQGDGVDLCTPLDRAVERTLEHWQAALDALTAERLGAEERERFRKSVPDVDLATGA